MKIGNIELEYGLSVKTITSDTLVIGVVGELINYSGVMPKNIPYVSIEKLLDEVESSLSNEELKNIFLCVNSPGGSAFGITDITRKTRHSNKNIIGVVGYSACSAAYWIVSACKKIIATTKMSYFGSIGVINYAYISDYEYFVTNKESYKKAPDIRTDKGKEIIQERLGAVYEIFISEEAKARNMGLEEAKNRFGDGKAFLTDEALKVGLIDELILDFNINDMALILSKKATLLQQEILDMCLFLDKSIQVS